MFATEELEGEVDKPVEADNGQKDTAAVQPEDGAAGSSEGGYSFFNYKINFDLKNLFAKSGKFQGD